jgi:hypothetical protein
MRQLLAAVSGLALCLLAGCTANSVEAAAKLAPLNADAIPAYYPKPGTVITFEVYEGGSSSNKAEAPNRLEEWTWAKVGADLQLTKKSADGTFTTELYDTQSSLCLKAVNGIAVSPCMPVLIDKSQPNPAGGFTGPLDDALKGSFKAEHEYLGPETVKIKNRNVTCHKVRGKRSFKSKSGEVQIETESWWAEGLGIVKRVESVTSKGLKRVTTLAQSPK